MTHQLKRFRFIILIASVFFFVTAFIIERYSELNLQNYGRIASESSQKLSELESQCRIKLQSIASQLPDKGLGDELLRIQTVLQPPVPWFSIFIYRNDSLVWWSDNSILPQGSALEEGFRFYKNGWYHTFTELKGPYKIAGLLKIRNQYAFQNRFLSNDYHPHLGIPSWVEMQRESNDDFQAVKGSGRFPMFYLKFVPNGSQHDNHAGIALLYIISYLLFLVAIYYIVLAAWNSDLKAGLITLLSVIITRYLSVYFNFPGSLYGLALFSPSYYASSFLLNSLGDLLISTLLITYLVSVFYKIFGTRFGNYIALTRKRTTFLFIVIVILFTFLYSVFVNYLLSGLIINSRISFNINNVFELDVYSLIGVVIIGILLFSFYLVCDGGVRFIQRAKIGLRNIFILFIISQFLFLFLIFFLRDKFIFTDYGISAFLLTNFLMVYSGYIRRNMRNIYAFTRYLLIIFGFSIYAAQNISEFNKLRERENRKVLAVKLENEQDQIAEYLFDDIADKVASDKFITGFFASPYEQLLNSVASDDAVSRRMTQVYFTGYWGKYDISIKSFNAEGLPVNTGGDPTWNLDYFNILIEKESQPTYSKYLFFSGNASGRISYIGRIPVYDPDNNELQTGSIIINLTSKTLQGESGFPELLISDKIPQKRDISNYSYAHYRNNQLVNQFGEFSYLVNSDPYLKMVQSLEKEEIISFEGHSHLFYKTGADGLLIISIRNPGILEFITLFSYLFSFYGVCFLLFFFMSIFIRRKGHIAINFKNRIQATVVVIVVVTMLLIGGATVYYIFQNYVTNLNTTVNDRLKSMLIAIQDELSKRSIEDYEISDEMNYTFSKLAATLDIDFNIYTSAGNLVYSTQPKIFDQAIVARIMNRTALDNLVINNKSLFVQFEEIGKLQYLSAYEPVRSNSYQTIGYINLPYFARQDELKKNISSFLVALINIYVLLFAFAIFITFIISSRITKPLQIIQQRLGKIKLGKRNELIEWDRDDEIGALVKEYNRMVEELSESAELLARSERESAWREMAKQVAHEIKNPLTPMKLSVQHLQRAWKEQSPGLDGIMSRVSQTLIEQIDTLSNIATEFSNFAKMPKANNEEIDLSVILKNTVALYTENESATITHYQHQNGNYQVIGDKDQLLRVFSNLLKNAIQAVPEGTQGHVHVEIKNESGWVIVTVKDNGIGISDDEATKIFTPNFTTKTGGMGLGLAMVKNIVEQAGGKVWFQSRVGEGTTFFVSFPQLTS